MSVQSLAFMETKIEGAHHLLHETHEYVRWQAPIDVLDMNSEQVFKVSSEAMRVTVRLTQIIAWLILQRAVLEGELSSKEFLSKDCQVLRGDHDQKSASEHDKEIPLRLRVLLKESREFYERVIRLDEVSRTQQKRLTQQHKKQKRVQLN